MAEDVKMVKNRSKLTEDITKIKQVVYYLQNTMCILGPIQIVTDGEVNIENYFPEVGNIPLSFQPQGIFPTEGKEF